jgi:hypothetical protein
VTRLLLALGAILATIMLILPISLGATELPTPSHMNNAAIRRPVNCGPCGCLYVSYTYHPELRSTYGLGFDPRNYDTTQPHYYLGGMRAFSRYYIDGLPAAGSC